MDLDCARYLVSPQGARVLAAAREARGLPVHRRAAALAKEADPTRVRCALQQDDLRVRALERCPHAERMFFTREGLEQASAWPVAQERQGRWLAAPGTPLHDLTAGLGLDALAAALAGRHVVAYERDVVRATLLSANADALGVAQRVAVHLADVTHDAPQGEEAFLDPGRRQDGKRTRDAQAFDPPAPAWPGLLLGFKRAMVKLPPVQLPGPTPSGPVEVVTLDGRARERRLFVGDWGSLPPRRALALPAGASVEGSGLPWPEARAVCVGDWLLDPDVSVTVAGLVGDLALQAALAPVHPRIAYLVGAAVRPGFPGTWLRVDAVLPPEPRALQRWLDAHGVGSLTLRKRGVEERAAAWRKRLRPSGPRAGTLVFTRDLSERWVVYAALD